MPPPPTNLRYSYTPLRGFWGAGHQEFNSPDNTLVRGHIYAGGRHLAMVGGGTIFSHSDWLGTERFRIYMTNFPNLTESCSSLPFGDGLNCVGSDQDPLHFTGKERDAATGLDNFGARYDSSSLGRFMSPDEPLIDQDESSPQSWNLYSYVRNNPLNNTDPSGNACVSNGKGGFVDDNSGGQTCAEANDPKNNNKPSAVVTAKAPPSADDQKILDFASELNKRNVLNNTFKVAGAGAAIGLTLGTACYYLCPVATVTTLEAGAGGQIIHGLYGAVSRAALTAAANSGGETVTVVTNLTTAPAAGQALSVATGEGAESLAAAARTGGQTFTAQVPKTLLNLLEKAGLAVRSTTTMGGATAQEIRFAPQAVEFVAKFFR